MEPVFGDAFYFIALLNQRDSNHERVLRFASDFRSGQTLTTRWVLAEVLDAMSEPPNRHLAVAMIDQIARNVRFEIVVPSDRLFEKGCELYRQRLDKNWSLTDCISFSVMADYGITSALTADHHFEQAGFVALLR